MKNGISYNGTEYKLPDIAAGKIVPDVVDTFAREEYLRIRAEKRATLYFALGLLGTLAGTILGWLLAKFF